MIVTSEFVHSLLKMTVAIIYVNVCVCGLVHLHRDWSLINGKRERGGGGACEVLPLPKKRGGGEQVLAMLKGGGHKSLGSFSAVA